jgi:uncharacterized DUF497 family protein
MSPVFEWDNRKAKSNFRKHRVHFTAAASVFSDPLARIFPDEAHSENEVREIINRALNREAPLAGLFRGTDEGSYPHHQRSPRDEDRTRRL